MKYRAVEMEKGYFKIQYLNEDSVGKVVGIWQDFPLTINAFDSLELAIDFVKKEEFDRASNNCVKQIHEINL